MGIGLRIDRFVDDFIVLKSLNMGEDDASKSSAELMQHIQRLQQQLDDLGGQCEQQSGRIVEIERHNGELSTLNDRLATENAALAAKLRELTEHNGNGGKRKRKRRTTTIDQRTLGAFGFGGVNATSLSTGDDVNVSTPANDDDNGPLVTDGDASNIDGINGNGTFSRPNDFVSFEDCSDDDVESNANGQSMNGQLDNDPKNWPIFTTRPMKRQKQSKSVASTNARPKEAKVTPIQLGKMNADQIRSLGTSLTRKVGANKMHIVHQNAKSAPRIVCDSAETKRLVINALEANAYQYHSFNNADSRKRAYIVRGLYADTEEDAVGLIRSTLESLNAGDDVAVSRFVTPYQRHHPDEERAPLYRIIVPAAFDERLLLDIRTIGYSGVKIEAMKKSNTVQCRNCQRLHHTTGQCHHLFRCVQCVGVHERGDCPRATNGSLPLGCVNCKEAGLDFIGHTANDLRNCNFAGRGGAGKGARKAPGANTTRKNGPDPNVSVKPNTSGGVASHSAANRGTYAGVLRSGAKPNPSREMDVASIVALAVQAVLQALGHGV